MWSEAVRRGDSTGSCVAIMAYASLVTFDPLAPPSSSWVCSAACVLHPQQQGLTATGRALSQPAASGWRSTMGRSGTRS